MMILINVSAEKSLCVWLFKAWMFYSVESSRNIPQNIFIVFICKVFIPPDKQNIGLVAKGNKEGALLDKYHHHSECV